MAERKKMEKEINRITDEEMEEISGGSVSQLLVAPQWSPGTIMRYVGCNEKIQYGENVKIIDCRAGLIEGIYKVCTCHEGPNGIRLRQKTIECPEHDLWPLDR